MILDSGQESLIIDSIKRKHDAVIEAIDFGDQMTKWRFINCITSMLSVLMYIDAITKEDFNFLCDGLIEKYKDK